MFPEILSDRQQTVLELLSRIPQVRTFYLAGGTALTLYLGHRRSQDFGFFRANDFRPEGLISALRETGEFQVLQEAAGTLTVALRGVPTSSLSAKRAGTLRKSMTSSTSSFRTTSAG